jgi:IS5 family transposase
VDNLIQRQLADKFGRYQKIERYKRLLQRATEDGSARTTCESDRRRKTQTKRGGRFQIPVLKPKRFRAGSTT